jgi:hypothetical protein
MPPPTTKPSAPPAPSQAPTQRPASAPSAPAGRPKLKLLDAVAQKPPRVVINGTEGWGKSSTIANIPGVGIMMAAGETGYETLLSAGLVPSVPATRIRTWSECLGVLDDLIADQQGLKALGVDAIGGFERMCHEHVCNRDFNGDWSEKGFGSYQKGYDLSVGDWLQMLARLDRLWDAGLTIVLLSHCKIKTFKNPMGADYDRYVADVHDKTWSVTHKWADFVGFGTFLSVIEGGKTGERAKKGKGIGMASRVLYTERRDSFDAKNRYGMPDMIQMPDDPSLMWGEIIGAMKHGQEQQ